MRFLSAAVPPFRPVVRPLAIGLTCVLAVALVQAPIGVPAGPAPASAASDPAGAGDPVRLTAPPGEQVATATVSLGAPAAQARSAGTQRFATSSYSMVGFTWQGAGDPELEIRTRSEAGWSDWQHLHVLGDGPTAGTPEGRRAAVAGATDAVWVGASDGIEVRVEGASPAGLEMVLIDPGPERSARAAAAKPKQKAKQKAKQKKAKKKRSAPRPQLRSRKNWGADNRLRSGKPKYTARLKQVHVHHTAGTNDYRRTDVKGLIRGMYAYHTKSLGWSDIGYNFLVDRFGRAWVGRAGGVGKRVQGAHTLGFNHRSVGIAVIGNHETVEPDVEAIKMVAKLASWKLDKDRRRATGKITIKSKGSRRFKAGTTVRLPRIDGHRDTNTTACPGELLYAQLPQIRQRTQNRIDHF